MNELQTFTQIGAALTGTLRQLRQSQIPQPDPSSLLLTARQGADLLGVSLRMFHGMRTVMPKPVVLGPRCVRWRREDLQQFVLALQAASEPRPEPPQLRAGRDKRQGHGGSPGGLAGQAAPNQAQPGLGRTPASAQHRLARRRYRLTTEVTMSCNTVPAGAALSAPRPVTTIV